MFALLFLVSYNDAISGNESNATNKRIMAFPFAPKWFL